MTVPRSKQVDESVTRWYHCISRVVRRANLLGEGVQVGQRKAWIQRRLEELDSIFAVSVGGFAILDNHLHVLVRLDSAVAELWTEEQVARRWFQLYPPRGRNRKPLPKAKLDELLQAKLADPEWIKRTRKRLSSLSWFMKCLKEPLARMVNKEENCTGAFFEGRFKSIAVLDEEALLAVSAYIDLNPVAAGIAETPEKSDYTSVKARVDHVVKAGRAEDLKATRQGSVLGSQAARQLEDKLWLIPIEDRRRVDSQREGMLEGFTLGNYLMLVEHTGRLMRTGKAAITVEVSDILERIGTSAEQWQARMLSLRGGRLLGRIIASSREAIDRAAGKLGLSRLANLKAAS